MMLSASDLAMFYYIMGSCIGSLPGMASLTYSAVCSLDGYVSDERERGLRLGPAEDGTVFLRYRIGG